MNVSFGNTPYGKDYHFVLEIPQPQRPPEGPSGEKLTLQGPPRLDQIDWSKVTPIEMPECPPAPTTDDQGRTYVSNLPGSGGLIVGSTIDENGNRITFPGDANFAAAQGAATHGFFFHNRDFLDDAVKAYSTLADNEIFRRRDINDINFVRDTLDFLTGGDYSEEDVQTMQKQIENIVWELSRQVRQGGEADLSKVSQKLTIKGAEIGLDELFRMQAYGRKLEPALNQTSVGQMDTLYYAKKGLAASLAAQYGKQFGEAGEMFADAIDRLLEKSIKNVREANEKANNSPWGWGAKENDSVETGLEITKLFSKLDTGSESAFRTDFSDKLKQMRQMVLDYGDRYGLSESYMGIAGDTAELIKYLNAHLS